MKKKAGAPAGDELAGGVQGQPRPHLPLSVPEIRRRLWRVVLAVQQTTDAILAWSHWRRWHQSRAKYYPYKRHGALVELLAA